MEDKILLYSKKYRKHQLRLTKVITIMIFIFGILCIIGGTFLSFYFSNDIKVFIGVIVVISGILDILLSFKFNKRMTNTINDYSDTECARRYCKVYGISLEEEKK